MKNLLFLLLSLLTLESNAQFTCGVSEKDITESIGFDPVKIFTDGLQINEFKFDDGSVLDYVIEDGIAVMSVFYPANYTIDQQIKVICDREFVKVSENRWHSKKGTTICKRIYENNKWRYVCQLMEF